ncbi:MAG: hypothetical protein AB7F65_02880 [Dehalococcoidia bacterium]
MDLGAIVSIVAWIVVLTVIGGAVQQILEGELFAGIGMLALGVVLLSAYLGGLAIFSFDALPIDVADVPGLEDIPGVSEFLGEEGTPVPTPTASPVPMAWAASNPTRAGRPRHRGYCTRGRAEFGWTRLPRGVVEVGDGSRDVATGRGNRGDRRFRGGLHGAGR